ncbi:ribosomal RNA processing element (RRPE)-binding protein [Schizosaccharomyces octosporus yFS286]|uniref:Ribosomal RNA processing element (RRPE)-binding protein n=1 Tax=Schizosaccharomyces octosporus (strain yFS286) TaxID=483514 RepID=S9Q0J8_SCHOY|nr:ribosomal RNA processing element (RRPE)-binding protein [Schizosaccharomyces octosporus yFS286]EPX73243.1 ribosomal RNA processing element (RRPE)-binding protein [Schizosaccharomyces octosporus yFS286]
MSHSEESGFRSTRGTPSFTDDTRTRRSSFSKRNFGGVKSTTTGGISAMMSRRSQNSADVRGQEYDTKELRRHSKSTPSSQLAHSLDDGKKDNYAIPLSERENFDDRRGSVSSDATKGVPGFASASNSSTVVDTLSTQYLPTILSTHGSLPIRQLMSVLIETYPMFNVLSPTQQRRALTKALESQKGIMFDKVGWGRWILRDSTSSGTSGSASVEKPSSSSVPNVSLFEKNQKKETGILQSPTERVPHAQTKTKWETTLAKEGVAKEEDEMEIDIDMDVPVKQTTSIPSKSTAVQPKKTGKETRSQSMQTPFSSFFASLEETPGSYTAHLGGLLSPREQTPSLFREQYHDNGVYYEEEDDEEEENEFYEDDHDYDSAMPPFVLDEDQVLDAGGESTDEEDWRGIGTEALLRKGNAVPLRRLPKGMLRKDHMAAEAMLMLHGSL